MNDIAQLQQKVSDLTLEIEAWKNKYYAVFEQYKLSQQRQFTSSSEKNVLQRELFDEAGEYIPEPEEKPVESIDVPAHKRTRAKRKPLPENLPRKDIIHDIEESEKQCDCGCQKQRFGEEITEQLEVVRPKLSVVRHIRPKYVCKQCDLGVTIAPMPSLLLPKSNATPSLITFIIISKYLDHLPLHR